MVIFFLQKVLTFHENTAVCVCVSVCMFASVCVCLCVRANVHGLQYLLISIGVHGRGLHAEGELGMVYYHVVLVAVSLTGVSSLIGGALLGSERKDKEDDFVYFGQF